LFKLLTKYKPEDKASKKKRLLALAQQKVKAQQKPKKQKTGEAKPGEAKPDAKPAAPAAKPPAPKKPPPTVKYGLNHITALVEQKKAKLVVIAHDVDPIELVVWLPVLCRKLGIPFVIVKGKARLGAVVRKKTATALALTRVNKEDQSALQNIISNTRDLYAERFKQVGGGKLGPKSRARISKKEKVIAKDHEKTTGGR